MRVSVKILMKYFNLLVFLFFFYLHKLAFGISGDLKKR
jgi:hypothetical protein